MPRQDDIPRASLTSRILLGSAVFLLALLAGGGIRLVHEVAFKHPVAHGVFWLAVGALLWALWRAWRKAGRPEDSARPARKALMEAFREAERRTGADGVEAAPLPTSPREQGFVSGPTSEPESPRESGDPR